MQTSTPARVGAPTLTAYKLDQPEYLTNNWKVLQANSEVYYASTIHKFAKVKGGVISVSNGNTVIRCPAALQDGFYAISDENEFIRVEPSSHGAWNRFPDYDAGMPNFANLDYTPPITKEVVSTIIEYMNFVRKHCRYSARIMAEGNTLIAVDLENSWLSLPHPVPIQRNDNLMFNALELKIVFTEMMRYDAVHIGFDNHLVDNKTLVIGKDWGHCALTTAR